MSDDIVERLREHATDWNGEQMPDLEPAKGDPTAGMLRHAADAIESLRAENARLTEGRDALVEALGKIAPIRVHNGPDYAEVYFADGQNHSTQAMTMNPQDWLDIDAALAKVKGGPRHEG